MKILNLIALMGRVAPELAREHAGDEVLTISPFDAAFDGGTLVKCEIGSLTYALALVCQLIKTKCEFFGSLDTALLSGESNVGEEEAEEIVEFLQGCELILVDSTELAHHPDAANLRALIGIMAKFSGAVVRDENGKEYDFSALRVEELVPLSSFDGCVVMEHTQDARFVGSAVFAMAAKLRDGMNARITTANGVFERKFELDITMKGTIALLGVCDAGAPDSADARANGASAPDTADTRAATLCEYPFQLCKIEKI